MEDECAPALRTVPAYLSRRSPTSRRHVGGRRHNCRVGPMYCLDIKIHEISVPTISPPAPTPILSARVRPNIAVRSCDGCGCGKPVILNIILVLDTRHANRIFSAPYWVAAWPVGLLSRFSTFSHKHYDFFLGGGSY